MEGASSAENKLYFMKAVRKLDRIVVNRGYPLKMWMDNDPKLVSLTLV